MGFGIVLYSCEYVTIFFVVTGDNVFLLYFRYNRSFSKMSVSSRITYHATSFFSYPR